MSQRRGTVPWDNLIEEICYSLPVVTGRRREISLIEAKFQEGDVLMAYKKFIEQKGRRPNLTEFYQFINNWEAKLIDENISFRDENISFRNEKHYADNRIQDLERENRNLLQELMILRGQQ